ncbi:MAG: DNA alkylation repair protein [Deltaproteobacteria bacterium]|jgi:3-methyladenine DNA glycosylase AlkC|nr:DNA alkylation repair protein [Deltaproteobacteria bacterium]
MPEPFKELFSEGFARELSAAAAEACPGFDSAGFEGEALAPPYAGLGLKERVSRLAGALSARLPGDLAEALGALFRMHGFRGRGFAGLPGIVLPEVVALRAFPEGSPGGAAGEDFEICMEALARLTVGTTAEFAVRPFVEADPPRALSVMKGWTLSPDEQVRRLASEGSRLLLPWGGAIPALVADPSPVLGLLEGLLDDPSLFVRRSCANSLNDVSKYHPGVFLSFAREHQGGGARTDWILRRGARTLLKIKDPGALALFGYAVPSEREGRRIYRARCSVTPSDIRIGGTAELFYHACLSGFSGGILRLEYLVSYPASGGGRRRTRLFFIRETAAREELELGGIHPVAFRDLSVRRQVPGLHRVDFLVNGAGVASAEFMLHR